MSLLDLGRKIQNFFSGASQRVGNFLQQYPTPASWVQKQATPIIQSGVNAVKPLFQSGVIGFGQQPIATQLTQGWQQAVPPIQNSIQSWGQRNPVQAGNIVQKYEPTFNVAQNISNPFSQTLGSGFQSSANLEQYVRGNQPKTYNPLPDVASTTKGGFAAIGAATSPVAVAGMSVVNPLFSQGLKALGRLTSGQKVWDTATLLTPTEFQQSLGEGLKFGAEIEGMQPIVNSILAPILNKLSPVVVKDIRTYLNFAKNAPTKEAAQKFITLAFKRVIQNVGREALSGGTGLATLAAISPAKDFNEWANNIKNNFIQGSVLSGGSKLLSYGTQGAKFKLSQLPKPEVQNQQGFIRLNSNIGNRMKATPKELLTPEETMVVDQIHDTVRATKDLPAADSKFLFNILTGKTTMTAEQFDALSPAQQINEVLKFANLSDKYWEQSKQSQGGFIRIKGGNNQPKVKERPMIGNDEITPSQPPQGGEIGGVTAKEAQLIKDFPRKFGRDEYSVLYASGLSRKEIQSMQSEVIKAYRSQDAAMGIKSPTLISKGQVGGEIPKGGTPLSINSIPPTEATKAPKTAGIGGGARGVVPGPLPWETKAMRGEAILGKTLRENIAQREAPLTKVPTDIASRERATLTGGGYTGKPANNVISAFQDWVNSQRARFTEGMVKAKDFQELDPKGVQGIYDVQAGVKTPFTDKLRAYFDTTREKVMKETGVDIGYKKNYLPQLWQNSNEEIQRVFGTSLNKKAPFSLHALIQDYQTGVEAGLTPRVSKVSDLVSWYESAANKAIADKKFFDFLGSEGLISSHAKAPHDWVTLTPDRFPKIAIKTDEGVYTGIYKAPPELGKMINNYLEAPRFESLRKIADFASTSKNRLLSFGIPTTAINAHGFNILARNMFAALGRGDIGQVLTGVKYMLHPQSAAAYLEKSLTKAPEAIHNGLTLSTSEYQSVFEKPVGGIVSKVGQAWNQAFEKPLFDKMIPALKLQNYQDVKAGFIKSGMGEKEAGKAAAKFTNDVYGGINWQELGESRDWQNLMRAIILAPDWFRSTVRLAKQIPTSFVKITSPEMKTYRQFAAGFLAAYAGANIINKQLSGHWMFQNEAGHTFEIETGYTKEGQKRYIRPFGTGADFARLPSDVAASIAQGNFSSIPRIIGNRLSTLVGPVIHSAGDTNYAGQPLGISGKTKYGQQMTPAQRVAGIGGELSTLVGVPSFLQQGVRFATGSQGGEQTLTQGLELPFRYSGGFISSGDKPISQTLGYTGKEQYDLAKTLKDQAPFSKKQTAAIQVGGKGILDQYISKRASDKQISNVKKQAEAGDMTPKGTLIPITTKDGSVKVIDTSFQPTPLTLTGATELDKKAVSRFNTEVSQKANDIYDLYLAGKLTQDEANTQLSALKDLKAQYAAPKKSAKLSVKKITAKKFKLSLPKQSNIQTIKIAAPPKPKLTKSKNIKITAGKPITFKKLKGLSGGTKLI